MSAMGRTAKVLSSRARRAMIGMMSMAAIVIALAVVAPGSAGAQQQIESRVDVAWNRFYDYDEMTTILRELVEAYPELLRLETLGRSVEGREMWCVTLNDPATGTDRTKPAMWIDGNIHGNEVQAMEAVLYSIWYLTKSYGKVDALTELIEQSAFYFVPSVNPDGRARWFEGPTNPHAQRSGQRPTDNDFDGAKDEDGPEDLDGDGHIGTMWRFDPAGRFRRNTKDPRLIERVDPDEVGELSSAGSEGIDNDGDGEINEDGPGGYDMNRNWPSGWEPGFVQFGAGDHPLSFPETRALAMFILDHPNIAAVQSYHNAGGMILRGPGAKHREDLYPQSDRRVYDELATAGEEMLPYYRSMVIHADLYTVHGGTVNWTAEGLGIVSFTNELWSDARILQGEKRDPDRATRLRFEDRLLFGQTFTLHTEIDHPTLGRVLVGGGTKWSDRIPPPFMLEEECHRNFAFTMFHAGHMPRLTFDCAVVERIGTEEGGAAKRGPDLWSVTVEVKNDHLIPTRTAHAAAKHIGLPDFISLEGATVLTAGEIEDRFDKTLEAVEHRPERLAVEEGIPSRGRRAFRFIVVGAEGAEVTINYEAQKARGVEAKVVLKWAEAAGV